MSKPASFTINTFHNLLKVRLEGIWDLATNIEYLNELSLVMRSCHNGPLVDMRDWIVTDEIRNFKSKINIQMDRRNQILECWLVDDMDRGSHVAHFIEQAEIPFQRF
jgi:hypothetical protein